MKRVRQSVTLCVIVGLLTLVTLVSKTAWSQTRATPTPTEARPIYTYFPSVLVCNEALDGIGPSTGLVTIGETTLQEIGEIYSGLFDVEIEHFEATGETLVYLRNRGDGTIYQRVNVCAIDGVIVASEGDFPSVAEIESIENETEVIEIPTSFERVGIRQFTSRFGVPDAITYSTSPAQRVAFWFERGVAAEFYIVPDPPNDENPPAFGTLSRVIYFPFQDVEGYEDRWPYSQTLPEARYIDDVAPFVATDVPTERNPFDFDAIIATIIAEPTHTPTAIVKPTP